jgi:carboxymethylenebutenolidase
MALSDYLRGEIAQDCADGLLTRREALRRLGVLGMTLTGATALLAACGADDDDDEGAASTTTGQSSATTTKPAGAETVRFRGPAGELQAAWAPASDGKAGVLLVHENRGLTPHFYDLSGRFAKEGYSALAVDLLSDKGGTAALTDPAAAPAALSGAPTEKLLADLRAGIDELQRRVPGKKVGAVGFCFGGGMVWNLLNAGEARLAAAVPFYGPAPENADFSKAKAAVLGIYGELDQRVNASRERAEAALKAAGLKHEIKTFPGANHAFFNDTGERYNADAARQAYQDVLRWFGEHLA